MAKLTFADTDLRQRWASGSPLRVGSRKMIVKKMSYGDYFLERAEWKGGECDGFAPDVIWLIPQDSASWVADDTIL